MSIRAPQSAGMERPVPRSGCDPRRAHRAPGGQRPCSVCCAVSLANTSAALILVLVIVAAACSGYRDRRISRRRLQWRLVRLLPDRALSEVLGRRRRRHRDPDHARACSGSPSTRSSSGAAGTRRDSTIVTPICMPCWRSPTDRAMREPPRVDAVGTYLLSLLDLDACSWVDAIDDDVPRLDRDGGVRLRGQQLRVDQDGLPTVSTVALPIRPGDPASPGFILTAASPYRTSLVGATAAGRCTGRPGRCGPARCGALTGRTSTRLRRWAPGGPDGTPVRGDGLCLECAYPGAWLRQPPQPGLPEPPPAQRSHVGC